MTATAPVAAGPVELTLYVSATSAACLRARHTVDLVVRRFEAGAVEVVVRDVADEPMQAEKDRILFTPTLVKQRPEPRTWIVGDLADGRALTSLLHVCGLDETS